MFGSFSCLIIFGVFAFVTSRPRIYRQTGSSPCPLKEQRNSPGTITSPGHPGPYSKNSTCTWIIAAPRDAVVWLEFSTFDIKSGPLCRGSRCKCDYVQIRGGTKNLSRIVDKFCEGHLPKGVIRTSSTRVRVHFASDMTEQGTGFSLKFWFVNPTSSPPPVRNTTTVPSLVVSEVTKQVTKVTDATSANVVALVITPERVSATQQTTTVSSRLIVDEPVKPIKPGPTSSKQVYTPTTETNRGFTSLPSVKYNPVGRPIKGRSTPSKEEPGPASGVNKRGTPSNNQSGPVVMFLKQKEEEKKVEEEPDPPDAIVLGPSIPIILIFIGVVLSIAWWKFRSDQKERLRYYKEQIRYEEISKRKRHFKKKQNMREIRTKRLYTDMTRSWQDRSQTAPPAPLRGKSRRTFAGRLLELAEKPVSYIRTPRPSRPSSMVILEQATPLVVMREKKVRPEPAARLDPGNCPPSRPASVLLRDALNMIFGATQAEPSSDSPSESPKDSGSENTSKRTSKRVSFYDALVEKMADVKETEDEASNNQDDRSKLAPLSIPHIMIRQPSCESGDDLDYIHRRSPSPKRSLTSEKKEKTKTMPSSEPTIEQERASTQQADPKEPSNQVDAVPEEKRPRSFDKKLVEMLEELQQGGDERERNDKERYELGEPTPPPVPHQTPDPRDSASTSPTGRAVNCSDLEDFLLNLDREIDEEKEQQP